MNIDKYIYSHCVSPQRIKIFDAVSRSFVVRELPCGRCLHCRNTKVNEWVTRLYAQAQYSNYVYYITLDYAPFSYEKDSIPDHNAQFLAVETAATWHNCNRYHKYGMQPILLIKNHLQDFLKRFRKRYKSHKIQYFACGEYGTHANGHGYGRPHFHLIVFSDQPITCSMFIKAWTLNDYQIGNVDYHDITTQAKGGIKNLPQNSFNNPKYVFRYVCKYLQKQNFDFEKLATINFHRAYFKTICSYLKDSDTLFPEFCSIEDAKEIDRLWKEYISRYSPFVCCSKRPSIGYEYLAHNINRFKERDFRLFGLPETDLIFPHYYLRKTKESFCSINALGSISQNPSSASRVGNILSVLHSIYDSSLDFSNHAKTDLYDWCLCDKNNVKSVYFSGNFIPYSHFHLYDNDSKIFYQFNGTYYTLWQKVRKLGYKRIMYMSLLDVINFVQPKFDYLIDSFLLPLDRQRKFKEKELFDYIDVMYQGVTFDEKYKLFLNEVYLLYRDECAILDRNNLISNNSKKSF